MRNTVINELFIQLDRWVQEQQEQGFEIEECLDAMEEYLAVAYDMQAKDVDMTNACFN